VFHDHLSKVKLHHQMPGNYDVYQGELMILRSFLCRFFIQWWWDCRWWKIFGL